MKSLASRLLVAAALVALPATVSAHRQWFLPSTTTLSNTEGWVTVDAAVSNDLFDADHVPMQTGGIKVIQPDGTEAQIQNAATGRYRSVFDVQINKEGTWRIGNSNQNVSGKFKLNGEDWTVGRRRGPPPGAGGPAGAPPMTVASVAEIPNGATDIQLTETLSRNEIFVTAGAPTPLQLTGKGLEFDPQTHPNDLVSDEPATFRFLIDGKPAAGLKIELVPGGKRFREAEEARELTTDANGNVVVNWPFAGYYWMSASATDNNSSVPNATERRMSYTTTLEVQAP